ncbi:MAG: glycosyltransferase family 2 protein [Clostridia bacterium]|nr:glycosyltransferase family 2 protein [Clostridia bacterium]
MISVIMPVFNEGPYIYDNVCKVKSILDDAHIPHRFCLVDDGSKDNTWAELCRLNDDLPNIDAIRLSRNFGKECALCAGLENAKGDAVVVMDADLQHPPEVIPEMVRLWQEEGYDVVEGIKSDRGKESFSSKLTALIFYRAFKRTTGMKMTNASDFKLMNRAALEAWKQLPEYNTFFRGLSAWVGFKRCELPFKVAPRSGGATKWTFGKLMKLALDSITAYTNAPLHIILWIGILMAIAAVILAIQTLVRFLFYDAAAGFPTVILLQLFIGSCIMISLSILGLYVARIYDEVKRRPRYLISEKRDDRLP